MSNTALTIHQFTIDKAVAEWLAQKEITGSKRTRVEYEETMRKFRQFLAMGNLDLLSNPIDISRVAGQWASMRAGNSRRPDEDISPSTYNQRLAIVSSWYAFVQNTYKLEVPNPIASVKKRKVQAYAAALPIAPSTVEQGLDSIDRRDKEGLRNYALLAVALATGRRASELVGLRGRDVKIAGGRRDVRITLTFHCKGNKIKRDLLDAETSAVLLEYLHGQYGKQVSALPPDAPVWVSYSRQNTGQAISARTLSNICAAYLETSKVHALRHTFAVGMIRSGAPITDLAGKLGHEKITTTQIYAKEIMGDENIYAEKLTARFGIKRKAKR